MARFEWSQTEGELSDEGGRFRFMPFSTSAALYSPGVLQAFVDAMPIGAAVLAAGSPKPRVLARNRAFQRMTKRNTDADHIERASREVRAYFAAGGAPRQFAWVEDGPGGRHLQVDLSFLPTHPELGPCMLTTLIDRTTTVESENSLRFEMLHDSLTGLPNRLAFLETVEKTIDGADAAGHAVLTLDLTRFSRVNESIGALAGDELIITVARRLVSATREGDLLARTAGDEFGLLVCLRDGPGDALHAARRLQEALSTPLHMSELEIRVDCAIGIAYLGDGATDAAEIVRNAQFALKRAKRTGSLEVYQGGEAGDARRRFSLETELRRAIEADQLDIAFQPLIDLETYRIAGFEVLARWHQPDRGHIPPIEFITVAEESGLINPLGRWVLDRAVRTLAEWDAKADRQLPIYFGVNVSPVQLARDNVPAMVKAALSTYRVGGDRLTLELTESSIIADPDRAKGVLDALKALHCRIAMDDFGTGYSNLAYLQRLPIDILKIDRGFVSAMFDDSDSTAIIRAILSLAQALGMVTIAEGIEDEQTARVLAALGCRKGQGYYFARPMTADTAFEYLMAGQAVRALAA